MTGDQYLAEVLQRWMAPTGSVGPGNNVLWELQPTLRAWANTCLADVRLSGSYAKGTSVRGDSDVDIFVSLIPETSGTLAELYESLANHMTAKGYAVRRQNVSIGITHRGYKVDLVPGRQQDRWSGDHSLFVRRRNSWTKTNIDKHVHHVQSSGHATTVVLMKRWRDFQGLTDIPSFVIELATLKALQGRYSGGLAEEMLTALRYLAGNIKTAALMDPANTNNNVADDLSASEKAAIAAMATASVNASLWSEIVQ